MSVLSKTLDCSCYELGHTWTPSCVRASFDSGWSAYRESFKLYASLYLLAAALGRKKRNYWLKRLLPEIMQSTLFLGTNGLLFVTAFCIWRKLTGFYTFLDAFTCGIPACSIALSIERKKRMILKQFFVATIVFLPTFCASVTAILLERKSRRGLLAVYMLNVAVETIWKMAVSRGLVRSVKYGEVFLFSVLSSVYMYLFRKPDGLRNSTLSALRYIVGSSELPSSSRSINNENKHAMANIPITNHRDNGYGSDIELSDTTNMDDSNFNDIDKEKEIRKPDDCCIINHSISDVELCVCANKDTVCSYGGWLTAWSDAVLSSSVCRRVMSVWTHVLDSMKAAPRHPLCGHDASCTYYSLQAFSWMFGVGYLMHGGIKLVSSIQRIIRNPSTLQQTLLHHDNFKFGAFLGFYTVIFKAVNCLLRWLRNKDDALYGAVSGFVAGLSMMWYRSSAIALYLASKLAEILYMKGTEANFLPYIRHADVVIFAISTALVFHAGVFEPHNLRPTYMNFLLKLSDNRFAEMNRHLLEVYGTNASKMYPDFWPRYDPKHTTLAGTS